MSNLGIALRDLLVLLGNSGLQLLDLLGQPFVLDLDLCDPSRIAQLASCGQPPRHRRSRTP